MFLAKVKYAETSELGIIKIRYFLPTASKLSLRFIATDDWLINYLHFEPVAASISMTVENFQAT